MADRFFPNEMPDFVPETTAGETITFNTRDSLTKLLYLPYNTLSEKLKRSALDLKETVVRETWGLGGKRVKDYTLYTGALGTAFLVFKAYQVTKNENDLKLCCEIVKACDYASRDSGHVTFICGRAGVCALGTVLAKLAGDEKLLDHYLTQFKQIKCPSDVPNELLYGRVGFLWACSFLNNHIGEGTISTRHMRQVADEIIKSGIMHVLMDMQLKPDEAEDVKGTLRYMIKNRFPSGNYPSSEGSESDRLVHWCHGAPGVSLTLAKAAEVFGDKEFLQAAVDAAEVLWMQLRWYGIVVCLSEWASVMASVEMLMCSFHSID
ncbi:hypothetical protein SLE2022_394230 [Rubroshorea leprosula]